MFILYHRSHIKSQVYGIHGTVSISSKENRKQAKKENIIWACNMPLPNIQVSTSKIQPSKLKNTLKPLVTHLLHKPFEKLTFSNAFTGLRQWHIDHPAFCKLSNGVRGVVASLHKPRNPNLQKSESKFEGHNILIPTKVDSYQFTTLLQESPSNKTPTN